MTTWSGRTESESPEGGSPSLAPRPVDPRSVAGGDSQTIGQVQDIWRGYDGALAGLNHRAVSTQRGLGFMSANPGAEGAIQDPATGRWFAMDLRGNPYSEAARIKHAFDLRRKGQRNASASYAYDGSAIAEQMQVERDRGEANYGLANQFLQSLLGDNESRAQLWDQAVGALGEAWAGDAERKATEIKPAPTATSKPKPKPKSKPKGKPRSSAGDPNTASQTGSTRKKKKPRR